MAKGLYIHIPFCAQKCKYCDFTSYVGYEEYIDKYIAAAVEEMQEYRGKSIDTVFIGGGTPTLLAPHQTEALMKAIYDNFRVSKGAEITSEANPGTIDEEKIKAMLRCGINRISVGVQSFNDGELKAIGRIHDAKTAYNNICLINKLGFENINIDLMSALPFQTKESLKKTLETAITLPITHISAYSLIIEDNTPIEKEYSKGLLELPSEDEDRDMYSDTVEFLGKHGFFRYEISNFAKKGYECRHNIKYWSCDEYIGIGAAAHSYVGKKRYSNLGKLHEYINNNQREFTELNVYDEISEFMIMGLRMDTGVSKEEFAKRFGKNIDELYTDELKKFISLGLMEHKDGFYRLTDRGIDVSNSVMCEFIIKE